jgi:hypothetical protein
MSQMGHFRPGRDQRQVPPCRLCPKSGINIRHLQLLRRAFVGYLYRARNLSNDSSTKSSDVVTWQHAMTNSQLITPVHPACVDQAMAVC